MVDVIDISANTLTVRGPFLVLHLGYSYLGCILWEQKQLNTEVLERLGKKVLLRGPYYI